MNKDVDLITYSQKSFILGLYTRLSQFERHFDLITTKYKYIAFTWLLATYAGIGFILSNETQMLIFSHLIGVAVICAVGIIGNTLIWHLDINIYHRFWTSLFVEEMIMEESHSFLLQSKKVTFLIDEDREHFFSQGLLYCISNSLLIITLGVSLVTLCQECSGIILFSIGSSCGLLLLAMNYLMFKWTQNMQKNLSQLYRKRRREQKHRVKSKPI